MPTDEPRPYQPDPVAHHLSSTLCLDEPGDGWMKESCCVTFGTTGSSGNLTLIGLPATLRKFADHIRDTADRHDRQTANIQAAALVNITTPPAEDDEPDEGSDVTPIEHDTGEPVNTKGEGL